MKFSRLLVFILPLLLTACGLSEQQKADYAAVQHSGVPSAIYDKMVHGDDLSIYDVETLSQAHVNSGVILRYMRDRGTIYVLGANDVKGLLNAGVSQSVIDYMMATQRLYQPAVYPVVNIGYGPYWGGPYYGGYYGRPYPGPYCGPNNHGWH